MRLYRLCSNLELFRIKNEGIDKLSCGGSLFRYIKFEDEHEHCNQYEGFENLWKEVQNSDSKQQKMNAILKVFDAPPSYLPLLEENKGKRIGAARMFAPNLNYTSPTNRMIPDVVYNLFNGEAKADEIFLVTVKVAAFYDNPENIVKWMDFTRQARYDRSVLEIEVDDEIAKKFMGKGFYFRNGVPDDEAKEERTEYAIPLYMISKANIVAEWGTEEFKKRHERAM